MTSRRININPSASDEEFEEREVEGTLNESKWRSSIRKKISRLGRKKRPMSWNSGGLQNSKDEAIGLSSQSLFVPYYDSPQLEGVTVFHRNRKSGSFLFSKTPFQEEEENFGNFFKKMFTSKKNDTTKLDTTKTNCKANLHLTSLKTRTLDNILERNHSKDTKREGLQTSQIKTRLRKFVSRGTLTSGIASFSTKFRERLSLPNGAVVVRENDNDLTFKDDTNYKNFEYEELHGPFRPKSNSVSEPCLRDSSIKQKRYNKQRDVCCEKEYNRFCENKSTVNENLDSMRFIDSSEEDIQGRLQDGFSDRFTVLSRNDILSSSFQGDFRPRTNTDWVVQKISNSKKALETETENTHFTNKKPPPDKNDSFEIEVEVKEIGSSLVGQSDKDEVETSDASKFEAPVSSLHTLFGVTSNSQDEVDIATKANVLPKSNISSVLPKSRLNSVSETKENSSESLYETTVNSILEKSNLRVSEPVETDSLEYLSNEPIINLTTIAESALQNREHVSSQNKAETENILGTKLNESNGNCQINESLSVEYLPHTSSAESQKLNSESEDLSSINSASLDKMASSTNDEDLRPSPLLDHLPNETLSKEDVTPSLESTPNSSNINSASLNKIASSTNDENLRPSHLLDHLQNETLSKEDVTPSLESTPNSSNINSASLNKIASSTNDENLRPSHLLDHLQNETLSKEDVTLRLESTLKQRNEVNESDDNEASISVICTSTQNADDVDLTLAQPKEMKLSNNSINIDNSPPQSNCKLTFNKNQTNSSLDPYDVIVSSNTRESLQTAKLFDIKRSYPVGYSLTTLKTQIQNNANMEEVLPNSEVFKISYLNYTETLLNEEHKQSKFFTFQNEKRNTRGHFNESLKDQSDLYANVVRSLSCKMELLNEPILLADMNIFTKHSSESEVIFNELLINNISFKYNTTATQNIVDFTDDIKDVKPHSLTEEMPSNSVTTENSKTGPLNIEKENVSKKTNEGETIVSGKLNRDNEVNKPKQNEIKWNTKRKRRKRNRKNKSKKIKKKKNESTPNESSLLTSEGFGSPTCNARRSSSAETSFRNENPDFRSRETLDSDGDPNVQKRSQLAEKYSHNNNETMNSDSAEPFLNTKQLSSDGDDKDRELNSITYSFAQQLFDYVEFENYAEDIEPIETLQFRDIYQRVPSEEEEAVTNDVYERCKHLNFYCDSGYKPKYKTNTFKNFVSETESFRQSGNKIVCAVCQSSSDKPVMCEFCEMNYERINSWCQTCVQIFGPKRVKLLKQRNHIQCFEREEEIKEDPSELRPQIKNHLYAINLKRYSRQNAKRSACDPNIKSCLYKTHVHNEQKRNLQRCPCIVEKEEIGGPFRSLSMEADNSTKHEKENKSVRWILSEGEDILVSHQIPQNTLSGITKQVDRFQDFFCFAKLESEKSLSLLQEEEHFERCSETSEDTQDLAKDLRRHISSFADRLHLTKDRLEDTAKCYLLLDKAYEWALEAMKVVGRVKSSGTATPEQVAAAAEAIGELLQENPPVSEETFTAMLDLATRLDNQTLLHQCKMAHARCKETISLLRTRQSALVKARRQMEFDCQSFVDLNEILSVPEDQSSFSSSTWLSGMPLNGSGRRRSGCSMGSRPRDPLSRCSSLETDDDSVFSESPFSSTPSKAPLEGKSSLRGIKELRESDEDLRGTLGFVRGNTNFFRSSVGSDFRICHNDSSPLGSSPSTMNTIAGSTIRAFSSGSSSSCSSSDSSGPTSGNKKDRRGLWRFTETGRRSIEETNDCLDDSIFALSPINSRASLPSGANSHLLIRGSQINLSNSEDLTQEEVRKNKTLLLIMQELIQTERDYVNSLEYIIENYIPELLREDIPQALRGQRNVIFGNIEKIYEFHSGYFLKALEGCRSRPFAVGSVFLRYENQFYLYALYNKNKPKSDELMADFGSSFFKRKQMALGDKMDLSSYLLKPVQRMGKYALLLKQLLKECAKTEEGYDELKAAQEMVQFQLRHGNDLLAMDSLRDCDVNLKEQGRLLRQGEFLVMEGSRGKKSLRHVFLFEDLILFSKGRKDPEKKNLDIFQYKQSLKTTDIGLTAQVGESPLRFEIWFRKRKPSDTFLFQASSAEVKEAWTEEISKLLWRQALRNRKLRLHEMSSMGIGNKPCLDIRPSEDQINDRSVCITKAPPRLKLTTSTSLSDASSGVRRPQSVISVSSSASSAESSSHSSSAGPSFVGTLNLGFESGDSPKPLQRSVTRTSQCSQESGIITDIFPERDGEESHPKVERSNSTVTNTSLDSALSPSSSFSQSSPLSPLEEPPPTTEVPHEIPTTEKNKPLLTTEV